MSKAQTGEDNPNWRGGRVLASNGYILIRVGTEHHLADVRGYAYEHRIVAEQALGRRLASDEIVHHRDGDKANNAAENLLVCTRAEHRAEHRLRQRGLRNPGQANETIACACGCGAELAAFDDQGRPRRFVSGHNGRKVRR